MTDTRITIVRGLTAVIVTVFLGVLGYYLTQPGLTGSRLALFAVLGGLAVLGTAGVFYHRELVVVGGACGLLLFGFWQAVLWIYIFPVVGVLLVAAAVIANYERSNTPATR